MAAHGQVLDIKDLSKEAANFEYNEYIPLRKWLHSADIIQKEARIYEREGNDAQSYLLLLRHAILILEKLSQHPESKDVKYKKALTQARAAVKKDLLYLETLKPRIEERFAKHVADIQRRKAQAEAFERRRREQARNNGSSHDLERLSLKTDDTPTQNPEHALDAIEHKDLAARLAQREVRRRLTSRQQTSTGETSRLSRQILEAGRQASDLRPASEQGTHQYEAGSSYNYPRVPQKSTEASRHLIHEVPSPPPKDSWQDIQKSWKDDVLAPKLPDKPHRILKPVADSVPPPVPGKIAEEFAADPVSRPSASTPDLPEPSNHTFKPSAYLENGTPLRSMFLPAKLRQTFLSYAAENTRRNLETCGILCGTLISNALFVSKLVIPDQKGTSDTCETINEEELFDYCEKEDLMVLGWIHTHPTQTCFMSSRDLHTHAGYQAMMPESIAIVCAPSKEPSWGIFRLTDPPGLKTILNCTQSGLFHPHSTANTYTDASKPGHVIEHATIGFTVKDMRPSAT